MLYFAASGEVDSTPCFARSSMPPEVIVFKQSIRLLLSFALFLLPLNLAWSGPYTILHVFLQNEKEPSSGLVLDSAGNAYGTTFVGGPNNAGTVYQLSPTSGFHVIYAFHGPDGSQLLGSLVADDEGNLYGMADGGGSFSCGENIGCGTVYKLSPPKAGGTWTETTLYNFSGGADGWAPSGGVVLDSQGNLYGTTAVGGEFQCGTVFELSPSENGQWTQQTLYAFSGDGCNPGGNLVFDDAGSLYGTAGGGMWNGGVAFQLSPSPGGPWAYTVLHEFNPNIKDGVYPIGLLFDGLGNLYGTTLGGGAAGVGTVYQLKPTGGSWMESILHNFLSGDSDGAGPRSNMVFDSEGRLYGATWDGGPNGYGVIYRLTPTQNGTWVEDVFAMGTGVRGAKPNGPLLLDGKGHAYGTTADGGRNKNGQIGWGVVFRLNIGNAP
jgi:uncharacterized repeat protein (TIGR03803 family)